MPYDENELTGPPRRGTSGIYALGPERQRQLLRGALGRPARQTISRRPARRSPRARRPVWSNSPDTRESPPAPRRSFATRNSGGEVEQNELALRAAEHLGQSRRHRRGHPDQLGGPLHDDVGRRHGDVTPRTGRSSTPSWRTPQSGASSCSSNSSRATASRRGSSTTTCRSSTPPPPVSRPRASSRSRRATSARAATRTCRPTAAAATTRRWGRPRTTPTRRRCSRCCATWPRASAATRATTRRWGASRLRV